MTKLKSFLLNRSHRNQLKTRRGEDGSSIQVPDELILDGERIGDPAAGSTASRDSSTGMSRYSHFKRSMLIRLFEKPFRNELREATLCEKIGRQFFRSEEFEGENRTDGSLCHLPVAGIHAMYQFALWCDQQQIFLHPGISIQRRTSDYRDHRFFTTCERLPQHFPVVAIPEQLLIGFKDPVKDAPEMQFRSNTDGSDGGLTDQSDVCSFFFNTLGLLISDVLSALHSSRTDSRHFFANSLHKTRTLLNAPYLENVVFDRNDTCLADVVLQMINNFISSGPLTGKVSRSELCWAVSISLSHSTPMSFSTRAPSIGIIPLVHLFPHGGHNTNSVVLANRGDRSAQRINTYLEKKFPELKVSCSQTQGAEEAGKGVRRPSTATDGKSLFVVPMKSLTPYSEVAMQPMAPICNADLEKNSSATNTGSDSASVLVKTDEEVAQMWRLSCGDVPKDRGFDTSFLAKLQDAVFEKVAQ